MPTKLTILHTNDLHGHIERLPLISTMVKGIRREVEAQGGHLLLWDAGDAEEKSLLLSSATKGTAVMAILNTLGYDLVALGNAAPVSYGPQALRNLAHSADFPILAANFYQGDSQELVEGAQAYHIFQVGGIQLGVIGLTTHFELYSVFGVRSEEAIPIVARLVKELKEHGVHLIAVLSHIGSEGDRALVEAVKGIDLIVGGHSHEAFHEPLLVRDTLIAQAGHYGEYLGRIDLEIEGETGRILSRKGELLPIREDIEPDLVVLKAIGEQEQRVKKILEEPIGELLTPLELAYDRECSFGSLLADVLRERMSAEVSIVLAGHLNEPLLPGKVTRGDLFHACFSPGNPARVVLRGEQIWGMLEHGLDPKIYSDTPHAFRGIPQGLPHLSGLRVRYDPQAPRGKRVHEILCRDQLLDLDGVYSIATSDWEIGEYTDYVRLEEEQEPTWEVPTIIREVLEDHFLHHSPVSAPIDRRLIPERVPSA